MTISRALKTEGILVQMAESFLSIPKLIDQHAPQVVILDLNMPTLTGEQIGTFLKRYDYKGKVVIYSGEKRERLEAAAQSVGAYSFVHKDQPLSALLATVKECLAADDSTQGAVRA
jgi:DNA-binding NtrC family response regulator